MTEPAPTILDALDHPQVFKPHFKGGATSWAAWRTFLSALFGLEMDEAQIALYRHHTGRETPPTAQFTEAALICGRRAGKSRILALIAVFLACFRDYGPDLAPGEVCTIPIIAADRKQARTIFRYVLGLINHTPTLAAMKGDETSESVEIGEHVVIEIHTASYRGVRSYTLGAVLIDEVAFLRTEESSANPDEEILAAVRPGLASIPGSMLLIGSSPYAKRGALYAAYRKHWAQDGSRVLVWRGGTNEMNPRIDPRIIEEAREADPARASAEYDAQFRDDVVSYISRDVVDANVVPGRFELPRLAGIVYHGYVDPSGGVSDSMTLAVAHREKSGVVVLDCAREIRPPFSPASVVEEFVAVLAIYGLTKVRGDRYAGEWAREPFRKLGVQYELAEQPASDLYRDLLPLLMSRRTELLDLPRLAKQLGDLERKTARSGKDSISHPPNGHDDLCNSVAGALLMASNLRAPIRIDPEILRKLADPYYSPQTYRR